jgi:predicted nucleic acid-binding protein
VLSEVYAEAEVLSAAHTAQLGTRALDVLHVAAATVLGVKEFFTFDTRQKSLAAKAGMKVRP